jgi:hypothetical protein
VPALVQDRCDLNFGVRIEKLVDHRHDGCWSFAYHPSWQANGTNHPLAAARKIYLARGFKLVAEEAHQSFGAELIGQAYGLDCGRCSPENAQGPCRPQA